MERLIGKQIGNYLILDELGRGGMARVFRARQINLDRECALKLLRPELAEDESFIDRFMREARAVARLDHPNIVPVYDTGRIDAYHFLAMKYLDGLTLSRILDGGRLSPQRVASYAGQAAAALEYAHQQGVVHRDVKPGNMIVDDQGWLTITDFGLARLSQEMRMTMTGTLLGTPAYMAPEQVSGDAVTPQTDIYQLGVVTYEMLTGLTPFRDRPQHAILLAHLNEQPEPVHDLHENLTPEIDAVVQRALAKAPADRFPSVSDFSAELIPAILNVVPADELTEQIGPYGVSRLPETMSWADPNITPYRIPTDRLDGPTAPPHFSDTDVPSEQVRNAERTTRRAAVAPGVPMDDDIVPSAIPAAQTAPPAERASSRFLLWLLAAAGGGVLLIGALIAGLFQFGVLGSGDDPEPTSTAVALVAPVESPTESATATPEPPVPPTNTSAVIVPVQPTDTAVADVTEPPAQTPTLRPTLPPQPTRTPISINTPTPDPGVVTDPPTATAPPVAGVPVEGQILFQTDFSDWFTGSVGNGEIFQESGTYRLVESFGEGFLIYAYSFGVSAFTDMSVSVDLRKVEGDELSDGCLLSRFDLISEEHSYVLCVDGTGGVSADYEFINGDGDLESEPLLLYGDFVTTSSDEWTTLKIVNQGQNIWFFVNGELAGAAQHNGPPGGGVGVRVTNFGDVPLEYEFTNLVVRALE